VIKMSKRRQSETNDDPYPWLDEFIVDLDEEWWDLDD
jgi:hypothetical protein